MKTVSKKLLSLLLVAILLVSAVPFQAFADHDASHTLSEAINNNDGTHSYTCKDASCPSYGAVVRTETCNFGAAGTCICGNICTHANTHEVGGSAATCTANAVSPAKVCNDCGATVTASAEIPDSKAAHTYGANGVCLYCPATKPVTDDMKHVLTLDANGGTVNGAFRTDINVTTTQVPFLPNPDVRAGYDFIGWFIDGVQISQGQAYNYNTDKVAVARYAEKTNLLTVRVVLTDRYGNSNLTTAKTVYSGQPVQNTNLLNFLNANVKGTVSAELNATPGYTWDGMWYDFSGTQPLTSQATIMDQAQTVFVKFVPNSKDYKLYFFANGGTVTPTSKDVVFGEPVGVLPTPYLSGKVFQGWKDDNGTLYTANTIYKVAGSTNLTAVWQDEALVILYVYINGDFSACNRMIVMDGFVKNNNISRADVVAQVQKWYTPASGYLNIAGLFDEYTWSNYRANSSKAGVDSIQIGNAHPQKIYVMVTNASTGSTVVNGNTTTTTPNTNGAYWVSTGNGGYWVYPAANSVPVTNTVSNTGNPKTGDSAMIELAAAVMITCAAALVVMGTMRKRKMI